MSSYRMLSEMQRVAVGCFGLVLMAAALYLLISACMLRMGRKYYIFTAGLAAAVFLLQQSLTDMSSSIHRNQPGTVDTFIIAKTPWIFLILFMISFLTVELILMRWMQQRKKKMLLPDAIKESLDALPDGICFADMDGQPLMVNIMMNQISGELFGTEILNARSFWKGVLEQGEQLEDESGIRIRTENERIWDLYRNSLEIGRAKVQEILACDVTDQYLLGKELERKNKTLREINERLRLYSQEVERITREKEILAAKVQLHDDLGKSLLAFRSYLNGAKEKKDRDSLLFLWNHTVLALKSGEAPSVQDNGWELLLEAARAVDVTITLHGKMPERGTSRDLIMTALHECLTNTVKHAQGNSIFAVIREKQGDEKAFLSVAISNNGKPPKGELRETGGLGNLRCIVEAAGGRMSIERKPGFLLRLDLPKGEETEWTK